MPLAQRSLLRTRKARHQAGFTLLEVLMALVISSIAMFGFMGIQARFDNKTRAAITGTQEAMFANAIQSYVNDNNATIASTASATTPVLITAQQLISGNYLPVGYSATNVYGQTACGEVLQPSAGQLMAILIAEGGTAMSDQDLGNAAIAGTNVGIPAGGIYSTSATTLVGALGNYSFAAGAFANANSTGTHCNGASGAVTFASGHPVAAMWFSSSTSTSAYLYRNAVPGMPQLNQMNTAINMNYQATQGTACTAPGNIAQNANQQGLVECSANNIWNAVGSTVSGIGPSVACSTAGQFGTDPVNNGYYCNGSYWIPLVVTANYSATTPTTCPINNQFAISNQDQSQLVCRNNFWIPFASLYPTGTGQSQMGAVTVSAGSFVAAPTCAVGGQYYGQFETIQTGTDLTTSPPYEDMNLSATYVTSPQKGWNITNNLVAPNGSTEEATTLTEIFHYGCSY